MRGIANRGAGTVALVLAVTALGVQSPAAADGGWGGIDCSLDPTNPACQVEAGTPGGPTHPRSAGSSGGNASCHDATGAVAPCFDPGLGWLGADGCYYLRLSPVNAPAGGVQPGAWYRVTCANTAHDVWMVDAQAPGPAVLGQQAVRMLALPAPLIRTNPSTAVPVLVGVPVWLWLDPGSWRTRSATASVPGVSVTATATPVRVDWSPGDGTSLTCRGPGTAWRAGTDPAAASPTCGHTYHTPSAAASGGVFTLSATTTWRVSWTGAGSAGTVPDMRTTAWVAVAVAESQALTQH